MQEQTNSSEIRYSVVIPCHNGAGYITRCFSYLAKQTYGLDKVEVVFVDDGSTDGSGDIAERYGTEIPHFTFVKNPMPTGPGGARNAGVAKATGEYLFFVDVDDYMPERSLELIDKTILECNDKAPDVVLFPYLVLRPESSKRTKGLVVPPAKNIQDAAFSAVGPWTHVCRRSLFVPFPPFTISEDTAWHFLQFDRFDTFAKVEEKEPCYVYDRTNATAITDTVEWAGDNSFTMEQLAMGDAAIKAGKNDQWISDIIRNYANMYDARRKLTKPWVKAAWARRFRDETANLMTGHFVH